MIYMIYIKILSVYKWKQKYLETQLKVTLYGTYIFN